MKIEVATRLHDAQQASQEIMDLTRSLTEAEFMQNRLLRLSVWKLLEIVGEALHRAELHDPHLAGSIPDLRLIVGTRNRITHGYDSIDFKLVLSIAQTEIPPLRERLEILLRDAPDMSPGTWAGA
jgi:uncharacterized protein with HEPN domain